MRLEWPICDSMLINELMCLCSISCPGYQGFLAEELEVWPITETWNPREGYDKKKHDFPKLNYSRLKKMGRETREVNQLTAVGRNKRLFTLPSGCWNSESSSRWLFLVLAREISQPSKATALASVQTSHIVAYSQLTNNKYFLLDYAPIPGSSTYPWMVSAPPFPVRP